MRPHEKNTRRLTGKKEEVNLVNKGNEKQLWAIKENMWVFNIRQAVSKCLWYIVL